MTVITSVSITYNCCSVRNFYNSRRAKQLPTNDANYRNLRRELPDSQVIKYCSLSIISILGMIFGFIWFNIPWIDWALNDPEDQKWYSVVAGWSNWQYRMNVYRQTRKELQAETKVPVLTGFVFSIPAIGIHLFISFGLGSEARKTYLNWLQSLAGLIIRVYSRLGVSSFRRKWGVASRGNDPENFTPFQLDDIRLEELTATWSASGGRPESMPPPYPTTHSPIQDPPKSLSTFNDLTPPTRVHRKDSRPDVAIPSAAMRRGESAGSQRYQD
ncbi:hypothetical protein FRC17_010585 [Serendipita sp. 399]|nr:hypothetical protein FRC17_010585 [Serendipita sp. 399]